MDLREVMGQSRFAVLGDTLNPDKYACKIKEAMLAHGYTVYPVGTELSSLNDIDGDIDVIDLCIRPSKGLKLLQECAKPYKCVVIQPGASDAALLAYLNEKQIPYLDGCLLVRLRLYT